MTRVFCRLGTRGMMSEKQEQQISGKGSRFHPHRAALENKGPDVGNYVQ